MVLPSPSRVLCKPVSQVVTINGEMQVLDIVSIKFDILHKPVSQVLTIDGEMQVLDIVSIKSDILRKPVSCSYHKW